MENTNINETEKKDKKKKGILMDVIVSFAALAVLVVCYFFWGCKYDLPATILAVVVVLAGAGLITMQHRKNAKDEESENNAETL